VVRLLLEYGAMPEVEAFCIAAARGATQIVQLLLDNSADVNAKGGEYDAALEAALRGGFLLPKPPPLSEVVEPRIGYGVDTNAICADIDSTPLYAATSLEITQVVKLLLQKGVDPNARGGEFGSALKVALERRNKELIILLIANGAVI
jgi:ankyrin repeat protein